METLVEHNALGRNPLEPKGATCRLRHVMEWTGWNEWYINKLVKAKVLTVKTLGTNRRLFYTAQIKRILEN